MIETAENYIAQIQNAPNGRMARKPIIDVLNLINEKGGNASTLGGHPLSYFGLKTTLTKWLYG